MDVVGIARDGAEAVNLSEHLQADLVLLDAKLEGWEDGKIIREIRKVAKTIRVVVFGQEVNDEALVEAGM